MRRPPIVLGIAGITALALLVAVALIVFQVNPQQDTNARNLNSQQRELARQVHDINGIICAQAQTTANSYRFRILTPSGAVEPVRHFLTRMQAQRQTLRLSRDRNCTVPPGFPPFEMQLERALDEINAILAQYSAKQREPVSREGAILPSTPGTAFDIPGFAPTPIVPGPPNGGTPGEEGAPYIPPKGHGQPPPASTSPSTEATPVERQPRSATSPAPVSEPSEDSDSPQSAASEPSPGETAGEVVDETTEPICTAIREVHNLC